MFHLKRMDFTKWVQKKRLLFRSCSKFQASNWLYVHKSRNLKNICWKIGPFLHYSQCRGIHKISEFQSLWKYSDGQAHVKACQMQFVKQSSCYYLFDAYPKRVLRCNVLRCNVLHCNVLRCNVLHCNVLRCNVLHCNVLRCNVLRCNVLRCNVDVQNFKLIYVTLDQAGLGQGTFLSDVDILTAKLWKPTFWCMQQPQKRFHFFSLRGSVIPFPIGFCYRQVAILLWLLGTTIIISPPYH
jgi:hypothetical protein